MTPVEAAETMTAAVETDCRAIPTNADPPSGFDPSMVLHQVSSFGQTKTASDAPTVPDTSVPLDTEASAVVEGTRSRDPTWSALLEGAVSADTAAADGAASSRLV